MSLTVTIEVRKDDILPKKNERNSLGLSQNLNSRIEQKKFDCLYQKVSYYSFFSFKSISLSTRQKYAQMNPKGIVAACQREWASKIDRKSVV